jgi:hypothetical protein
MGTRSLTHVFKGEKEICCIYRQFDGYPSVHGKELADFILSRRFVNGISGSALEVFNGAGCFAAALVGHLKGVEAGGIYLYPAGSKDCGEEYTYKVYCGDYDNPGIENITCSGRSSFSGSAEDFKTFCLADD